MSKVRMEETLCDVVNAFARLQNVMGFSANELALFHSLLVAWNSGGRPVVVSQWVRASERLSGLSYKALVTARRKLVEKGVIFFHKGGNREQPLYSFLALVEGESPFLLSAGDGLAGGKEPVKGQDTGHSKQSRDRERDRLLQGDGSGGGFSSSHESAKSSAGGSLTTKADSSAAGRGRATLEEVMAFAKRTENISAACAETFWEAMQENGWRDTQGRRIRVWRSALQAFSKRWNVYAEPGTSGLLGDGSKEGNGEKTTTTAAGQAATVCAGLRKRVMSAAEKARLQEEIQRGYGDEK